MGFLGDAEDVFEILIVVLGVSNVFLLVVFIALFLWWGMVIEPQIKAAERFFALFDARIMAISGTMLLVVSTNGSLDRSLCWIMENMYRTMAMPGLFRAFKRWAPFVGSPSVESSSKTK